MPREQKRAMIRALCSQRRVQIVRSGAIYRLLGRGVDIAVVDLADVDPRDLEGLRR